MDDVTDGVVEASQDTHRFYIECARCGEPQNIGVSYNRGSHPWFRCHNCNLLWEMIAQPLNEHGEPVELDP